MARHFFPFDKKVVSTSSRRDLSLGTLLRGLAVILVLSGSLSVGRGQETAPTPTADANPETVKPNVVKPDPAKIDPITRQVDNLKQRIDQLERSLLRLQTARGQQAPAEDRGVLTVLESPALSRAFSISDGRIRCFVTRVLFVNMTKEPLTIDPEKQISLIADGQTYTLKDIPKQIEYQSIGVGVTNLQLGRLKAEKELHIPVGSSASTYLVFAELPQSNHVPNMTLQIKTETAQWEVDINERVRGRLNLDVDRIGPHDSLALLTISGELNSINVRDLVETLDQVALARVGRAVIRFSDTAAGIDGRLAEWLKQSTIQADDNRQNESQYPSIPTSIRELHISRIPEGESARRNMRRGTAEHVHQSDIEAITAALTSAYESIPRDELIRELEKGDQLTRAAAIAGGGGRLSDENLPMLLEFTDNNDVKVQEAALMSLRHFGDPAAIARLAHYMRKGTEPLASTAVESLAASRFPSAHTELLKLIQEETAVTRQEILSILARYPRPIWRDTIYQYATNFESGSVAEAIEALIQVGHPQLLDVLAQSLEKGDRNLRKRVFDILVKRSDPESEKIATDYVLKEIETKMPTQEMLNFLTKTREQRAIPFLLTHLRRPSSQRSVLINALAQMGDETVVETLVEIYPQLTENDQAKTLAVLQQMHSPQFRHLAGQALQTSNGTLITAACTGLQNDGSQEAVNILINALDSSQFTTTWSRVCNALSKLATSEARAALKRARDSEIPQKSNYAISALRVLRQSSPGYAHYSRGRQEESQQKWNDAIEHYTLAIRIDDELIEAYLARANVYLRLNNHTLAMPDFRQSMQLEPGNADALTGAAICSVVAGEVEKGIEFIESVADKHDADPTFAYNTACVYSRALEYVRNDQKYPNRDVLIPKYENLALDALQKSVKLKFRDFDWMREDPDLKALHENSRFQAIAKSQPTDDDGDDAEIEESVPEDPRVDQ